MEDIEIKTFAPVLIPTLNRFSHFYACLESLKKCTWANQTDVYIALDYPVKKEHIEGYKKIDSYLNKVETDHPFKSLHIIRRTKNFGIGYKGNAAILRNELFQKYDRIIFSEDDNIFSIAFLDFINKGLELYKNDKSIISICGYKHYYNIETEENSIFRQNIDFSAWGYGIWKDRFEELNKLDQEWFKKHCTLRSFFKIKKSHGNLRALQLYILSNKKNKINGISDNMISIYMGLINKDVIMPVISCVKNIGTDGSGVNFNKIRTKLNISHLTQPIYAEPNYPFQGDPWKGYNKNNILYKKQNYNAISNLKLMIKLIKETIKFLIK